MSNGHGKPNIIFIMADDLGYADLGCYGQTRIRTPHSDRMAEGGIRFTQCYAGAPICAPCRSVLMTGQHTGHTRIRGNFAKTGGTLVLDDGSPQRRLPLREEDVTVAEVLKQEGYTTGITGKWGLGEPGTTGVPNRKGFDEWLGYLNQRRAHTYYPPYLWRNEDKIVLEDNAGGRREQYSHDLFADFALDFISKNQEGPFFLYLSYTLPHAHYEIPSIEPYDKEPWEADAKAYAAMVSRLDRDVGDVMERLSGLGIDGETIVFLCSDNGAAKRWDGLFDSCGELRGKKGDVYEGGIRTPMIVRWPGKTPKGATSDAPWYFADFMPTAAELAGGSTPPGVDGISVLPTLLGEGQGLDDRYLYWEWPEAGFRQAARIGNWKAVRCDGELELYDIARDPGEGEDVSVRHPDIVQAMEKYLETARNESEHWPVE
jgi:arylsulfatase A-like enzyme